MKKIIISLASLLPFYVLFAQNQRVDIIFKDGTIIEGFGMIWNDDEIKFRLTKDEKASVWTDLMVKGIILYDFETSTEYEYIKLSKNQSSKLLEVVKRGKINIYDLKTSYIASSINYGENGLIQGKYYHEVNASYRYVKRDSEEVATNLYGNFKKKARQ